MVTYRLKPCGNGDCPPDFSESTCKDYRGCEDGPDNYIFTQITRYWIGSTVTMNGVVVRNGDRVDTYFYDPPREINDGYQFSKVTVTDYLGWDEENDPEPEPTEHGTDETQFDNYFGCMPDPNNPGRSIKFQQPGTAIMNGYLTEDDIVDGVVVVSTFWQLHIS